MSTPRTRRCTAAIVAQARPASRRRRSGHQQGPARGTRPPAPEVRHQAGHERSRFVERDNEIVFQPLTRDYIRGVCGMLRTDTSASRELLKERARDREREERR
jgi:hypothetical protein